MLLQQAPESHDYARFTNITRWLAKVADYLAADVTTEAAEWLEAHSKFVALCPPARLQHQVRWLQAFNVRHPRNWFVATNSDQPSEGARALAARLTAVSLQHSR